MSLKIEKPKNPNYCGTVVKIEKLQTLAGCDNVVAAIIFSNSVIVGKDTKEGDIGLFFPVETQLSDEFLHNNNLYRHEELNKDTTKKGYFEDNRRIKLAKFRGHKSEGFFIPINSLSYLLSKDELDSLKAGTDFDIINKHEICRKYYVKISEPNEPLSKSEKKKKKDKQNKILDGQYRLHFDTENLDKNVYKLTPDDIISVGQKVHGTSFSAGKVLIVKKLSFLERIVKFLKFNIIESEYSLIYSSRKVIKSFNKGAIHFYNEDIWGIVAKELENIIPPEITLYGEICGYLSSGEPIQTCSEGDFDYGCEKFQHKVYIYRITSTNYLGQVIEFSWQQVMDFCNKYGLNTPPLYYYGYAKNMYPNLSITDHWHENFLAALKQQYITDQDCPLCINKVPFEGICLSIDSLYNKNTFKLKTFRFRMKETEQLNKNILDIETSQTIF